jgi:hypothetical protein
MAGFLSSFQFLPGYRKFLCEKYSPQTGSDLAHKMSEFAAE